MVGGSDVSQEHVLSLVRVERLGPSLTLQKSEWGCSVIVLASCKAGCIMNHRRGDSSISHFLPHCNYWLGLLWHLLVPSLQLTCVSKSHPHRQNFSNCRWRQHVAPKLQNISIHPEHTWWQNWECYSLNVVTPFWDLTYGIKALYFEDEGRSSAKTMLYISTKTHDVT